MMRKTITRTMVTSTIVGCTIEMVDGKPRTEMLEPVTVMGKANEKDAMKALREKFGKDKPLAVCTIDVAEDTYEISVDDFIKHAKKVEPKENEKVETK